VSKLLKVSKSHAGLGIVLNALARGIEDAERAAVARAERRSRATLAKLIREDEAARGRQSRGRVRR